MALELVKLSPRAVDARCSSATFQRKCGRMGKLRSTMRMGGPISWGASRGPPKPPDARDAPAQPWRPSRVGRVPKLLDARDAPAQPWRPSRYSDRLQGDA